MQHGWDETVAAHAGILSADAEVMMPGRRKQHDGLFVPRNSEGVAHFQAGAGIGAFGAFPRRQGFNQIVFAQPMKLIGNMPPVLCT